MGEDAVRRRLGSRRTENKLKVRLSQILALILLNSSKEVSV